MSSFKIDPGNGQKELTIKQGIGDVKAGIRYDDLSRISAYDGKKIGLHTGSDSVTLARQGKKFGK